MKAIRRAAFAAALCLLAPALVLAAAAPAHAHNYLVSSTPAEGEVLTEVPERFSITTNEALLDLAGDGSGFALQVVGPDGLYYGDGCLTVDGSTISTVAEIGDAGDYTVLWQVISGDGHTASGEYGFTWEPAAGFAPAAGSAEAPLCDGGAAGNPDPPPVTGEPAPGGAALMFGGVAAAALAALAAVFFITRRRKD